MSDPTGAAEAGSVDQAINEVLAAERDAREAVEQCRAEAGRIVAEAEERARSVANSAERRIRAAHRMADKAVDKALKELLGPPPEGADGAGLSRGEESLERAVAILADEIIGSGP